MNRKTLYFSKAVAAVLLLAVAMLSGPPDMAFADPAMLGAASFALIGDTTIVSKHLRALLERKDKAAKKARATLDAASAANRVELTADEQSSYDAAMTEIKELNAAIEREQAVIEAERTAPAIPNGAITGGRPRQEDDPQRGFASYGEYCRAVANVSMHRGMDERLKYRGAAPSTYGGEDTGADGGFAVPPQYSRDIWQLSLEQGSYLPLTDNMPIEGNSLVFPSDETTPWGTDGVRAYWEGEAEAATATKPKLAPNSMRLKKLMALVPVSDELLSDSSAMPAYLASKTATSIRWKTNEAIINGTGVGQPLGITVGGGLVVQAKESSQTAATINANNVAKMHGRLLRVGGNVVWLIHPDAFNQIITMTVGDSPIWTPPQAGFKGAPDGFLLGRPIDLSENCQTLGTQNDILLVDFKGYRTITKSSGIETATSMHLYFDAGATAFRATFRIDGQPIVKTAVSPAKGSSTRSPYVTLAVRA